MPPSPALRISPARELRTEIHKRGRSLEGGLLLKDKDDDLALFNDMQNRERENFLLQSTDDFDDSLSAKLRYFSDLKLGISIPVRGESSDLLNADGDKNDYDWLLTPPDTPLFTSLDDDPPPVNLVHRGRPCSQPISISRSAKVEKSYRTGRSSASPNRLSSSPRSVNSTIQTSRSSASPRRSSPSPRSGSSAFSSRGRPSSVRQPSPNPPILRPATPSRRPSTPPNKPSSPAPRSTTPTVRRMSTGSSSLPSSSGRRAPSPGKANRGNSASPKLQAWQTTLPGFSSDPPPNLRTSLSDRPASHVRGLSPASSRNGRDSYSKFGRQSMSPTASRSASSSHSHERDHFSSQSKGSVASSGDDELDSLQSAVVGVLDSPGSKITGAFASSKAMAFSKKPSTRTHSASSAPKRSFDSALRQMDQRKSPQNMFRPLLSSVPTTTFYVGKPNSGHRSMISRNSSITTSSNTSSEQGASVAHDTEGSDHDRDVLPSEWGKSPNPDAQEEVFIFDKVDEVSEDIRHEVPDGKPTNGVGGIDRSTTSEVEPRESESNHFAAAIGSSESLHAVVVSNEVDCCETLAICSICGNSFPIKGPMDGNADICPDCAEKGQVNTIFHSQNSPCSLMVLRENKVSDDLGSVMGINELQEPENNGSKAMLGQQGRDAEQNDGGLSDSCLVQMVVKEGEQHHLDLQSVGPHEVSSDQSYSATTGRQLQHLNSFPSLKVDGSEGTGISVLLKRSSSSKWPVVQGRAFTATNIVCNDPSYTRDNVNATRSFIGSASSSSSIDLSSRQTEFRVQRQLSSRRAEMESSRDDSNTKLLSTRSSFSGISSNVNEALIHAMGRSEESYDDPVRDVEYVASEETSLVNEELGRASENAETANEPPSFTSLGVCDVLNTSSAPKSSSHMQSMQLEDTLGAECLNVEESVSSGSAEVLSNNERIIADVQASTMIAENPVREEDVSDTLVLGSSYMKPEEMENGNDSSADSKTEYLGSPSSKNIAEILQETLVSTALENDLLNSDPETNFSDHASGVDEKSTITVEGARGQKSRSLTLDEATDTILFCSSIIHDLAYQAATIALEKENPVPLEGSRPTVTILGKTDTNRRDLRSRATSKRMLKSQKGRQRRVETDTKTPSSDIENDSIPKEPLAHNSAVSNKVDSMKPTKLESKCNCTVM